VRRARAVVAWSLLGRPERHTQAGFSRSGPVRTRADVLGKSRAVADVILHPADRFLMPRTLDSLQVVGFFVGYIRQDFTPTFYCWAAGAGLAAVLTLPPWPLYARHPVQWLAALPPQADAAATSSAAGGPGGASSGSSGSGSASGGGGRSKSSASGGGRR
jgi:uncharacterized membrane protein YgcG